MVRPERFELPAYWFVASRSIQLSYGRTGMVPSETIDRISGIFWRRNRSLSCRGDWFRGRRRRNGRHSTDDLQAGLADKIGNAGGVEPGGVVLHAQGAGGVIEAETADAVDILCAGQREGHGLSGRRGVGQENFHRGHNGMIPRRQAFERDPTRYRLLRNARISGLDQSGSPTILRRTMPW